MGDSLQNASTLKQRNLMRICIQSIPSFSQIELTEKQLIDKLQHVKKKTGGTDNISSRELSEAGETLSEGLYSICKNSIKGSVHPGNWKNGMVIPAFKKGILVRQSKL